MDDLWLFSWETPDIKEQTAQLLKQLKPLYQKIHAYVRMKLKDKYPDKMPKDGTIPAHLLGNMWAQQWSNIMQTIEGIDPFPDMSPIDVTKTLEEKVCKMSISALHMKYLSVVPLLKEFTSKQMFELSEKFFVDLGLEKMTQKFWKLSIFDKLKDKVMVW